VRFDDSLKTVLASDAASEFGAQATWRQLVDLIGRGRVEDGPDAVGRLRALRASVPLPIRAASARALAFARPPAPLVALFAEEELAIAAPVLRTATLPADDWLALLPTLTPQGRSVLRHRRDLPDAVVRGLESLGNVDFVLEHEPAPEPEAADVAPAIVPIHDPIPTPPPVATILTQPSDTPFQPLAAVARDIPVVAEALRRAEATRGADEPPAPEGEASRFEIADLVARIDAFQRDRPAPSPIPAQPEPEAPRDEFSFETDAAGTIRWVQGVTRSALVGVSLAHSAPQGLAQVDGVAAGAFRGRARFAGARLAVEGGSNAAGAWRLAATPAFDADSGRFIGYRGQARRPRPDEMAQPRAASDSLRQLVHELRTPTNAIAGFAELIETQLLGPVAPPYRDQAGAIRRHTLALLGAIDDLDTAARITGHALELRASSVAVEPLLARVLADLAPLARLRGAGIAFDPGDTEHHVHADDRAVERLVGRLLAALVAASGRGERLRLKVKAKGDARIAIHIDRPAALAAPAASGGDEALFAIDAVSDGEAEEGAPLLGTGFALRLARNLAVELGGSLTIGADRLTLRLPAALDREVGQTAQ
jgi:signal transduction histidine kinase